MFSFYGSLSAEVYDLDKPIGRSFGDVEFYKQRLAGITGRILEPAVGTGRILIPLLESGFVMEGFDLSEDMLKVCRAHCEEKGLNPVLTINKMESFSSVQMYDAIILPVGTFLLLHERERSIQALKNFYQHLAPDGKLVFDVYLESDFTIGNRSVRSWKCENGDIITLESTLVEVDFVRQFTVSHGKYEKWRNGKLIQTELERYHLRWYGVEELKLILSEIGFTDIVISSDYNYGEYPKNKDDSITYEAIKK